MEFPEDVLAIVRVAARKHANDIPKAIDQAERDVRRLPGFPGLVNALVRHAVQDLVYDLRSQDAHTLKNGGDKSGRQKVSMLSPEVEQLCRSLYDCPMAGTTLGEIRGEELEDAAATERARADGHAINAHLLAGLRELVPHGKRVRDAVPEAKLRKLLDRAKRDVRGGEE
jgi:hypothetical protein